MEVNTIPLQLASIAILVFSLALGFILLRLRDIIFGGDVSTGDHHIIDFNKKIEEEEQLNLDQILNKSRCGTLNTASVANWNSKGKGNNRRGHVRENKK